MTEAFDKIQKHLFDDEIPLHEAQFTPKELELRNIYREVFTYWLDKPLLSKKKIVQYIIHNFGKSKTTAYRYMMEIQILLGDVSNANKEWHRYRLIQMVEEAYDLAIKKKNPIAAAAIMDKYGKYTQLDKEDQEKIPFDEIVPQNFEPSDDVSVLGIKPIKHLRKVQAELRKKYGGSRIEEAEFEIIEKDQNE